MKSIKWLFVWAVLLVAGPAFSQVAGTVVGTGSPVASLVIASPVRLYQVNGWNTNAANLYVHVFQTNALPSNGTLPFFIVAAPAQQTFKIDLGCNGLDLDYVTVAFSTTTNVLTVASASGAITAITGRR